MVHDFEYTVYSVHTGTVFFLSIVGFFFFPERDASIKWMNQYEYLARGRGGYKLGTGTSEQQIVVNDWRNSTEFSNFPK